MPDNAISLPVIIEDADPNVVNSGTDLDAASVMPNLTEIQSKYNSHKHPVSEVIGLQTALSSEAAARAAADTAEANARADADALLTPLTDARLADTRTPTDGTVTDAKIVAGGLSPAKIAGTAVVTSDARLSDTRVPTNLSVSTGKLIDGAVTAAKVAADVATQAELDNEAAARAAADALLVPLTQKGVANGVASLGSDGLVPAGQLPDLGGSDSEGVGAPSTLAEGASYYELNGSGQVIAIWLGTAGSPVKVMDVLTGGAITPMGVWSAGTAYGADAVVTRNGSSYIAISGTTGVDPATDAGVHWMLLAAKGDTGPQGDPGSAGLTDGSVLNRYLSILSRPSSSGWMIDATSFAMNHRRDDAQSAITTVTRQLLSTGGLVLPGGKAVTTAKLFSGSTALAGATHQFVAFYNARTLALLASGSDVTSQAWSANSAADFPISYTPSAGIEVIVVYYVEATTVPSLAGKGASVSISSAAPRFGGLHDTLASGSGPGALPGTLGTAGTGKGSFYVEVR